MKLSIGNDNVNFKEKEVEENIESIGSTLLHSNWSCSLYKESHRKEENFLQAETIALDFDNGLTLDQATKRFKDFWHCIATTRNHQKEKNGIICDRFRVLLKLEKVCFSVEEYRQTYLSLLNSNPESDRATKDAARLFYKSTSVVSSNFTGKLIPIVKPILEAKVLAIVGKHDDLFSKGKAALYLSKVPPSIAGQNGDLTLYKAIQKISNDFNLADDVVLDLLLTWDKSNQPPWGEDALRAKIESSKKYSKPSMTDSMNTEKLEQVSFLGYSEADEEADRAYYKILDDNKFTIFHPKFLDLPLTYNTSCLFAAPSNNGKTTFAVQTAAFLLKQNKKVLFLTNQEERGAIGTGAMNLLSVEEKQKFRMNLTILDTTCEVLKDSDRVVNFIFKLIEEMQPDIVLFDHLNECTVGKDAETYIFLPKIARQIETKYALAQSSKKFLPPIISFVQTHPLLNRKDANPHQWDIQSLLADSKKMFRCFHVGLLFIRWEDQDEGVSSYIKVGRVRKGYPGTFGAVSRWRENKGLLVPWVDLKTLLTNWKDKK